MEIELPTDKQRPLRHEMLLADLLVVGGGVAGTCAAIAAAREGLKVALVQDRPVLGGNGSSEVRLWWLGATCHGMTNNRWAREPGIVNELMLDNLYSNPEGNPVLVDLVLLGAVHREPNITLLLNTAVHAAEKSGPDTIRSVSAFCSQNSTGYTIEAPLFCDASGDGILGFIAGAAFRMGAEKPEEFDEPLAPGEDFGELLGDSIYFYTKDAGQPVPFVAPSFADKVNPADIHMMKYFDLRQQGCQLWWIETGGRFDTVHKAERIKWDLWKLVYGIWDYIKNSGDFPDAANATLDWVGAIPGKRESRRFEGDAMITQRDIVHATPQPDAVGFGGWAIDLHPADGALSKHPPAIQYLTRRIYPIPYRCLYSRNIENLFLGGRTMSASHVAFGSTRVMATLGQLGESIGTAASLCLKSRKSPAAISIADLQVALLRKGCHLPGVTLADPDDLAQSAALTASSEWSPRELPPGEEWHPLDHSRAQMLPLGEGTLPVVVIHLRSEKAAVLTAEWRIASLEGSHTPDATLGSVNIEVPQGESSPSVKIHSVLPKSGFAYLVLRACPGVEVRLSSLRATALLNLQHKGTQKEGDSHNGYLPAERVGCESFELWFPDHRRRYRNLNFALQLDRPLAGYGADNVLTQPLRPTNLPNAWLADPDDAQPTLTLKWDSPQTFRHVRVFLDPDWDHPLETVIKRHGQRVMPSLVRDLELLDAEDNLLATIKGNRSSHVDFIFKSPQTTDQITLRIRAMNGPQPAAVFGVRVWKELRL